MAKTDNARPLVAVGDLLINPAHIVAVAKDRQVWDPPAGKPNGVDVVTMVSGFNLNVAPGSFDRFVAGPSTEESEAMRGRAFSAPDAEVSRTMKFAADRIFELETAWVALREELDAAQAEIAALRGELPDGWEADPPCGWVETRQDDGGYSLSVRQAPTGYAWEAWTLEPATRRYGTAPTLLGAIAACEAARPYAAGDVL